MVDGYIAHPSDLEHDAKVFDGWSKSIAALSKGLPSGTDPMDFSVLTGGQQVYKEFEIACGVLDDYIKQGVVVFNAFARKLLETEESYLKADHDSQAEIDRIAAELAAL